MRCIILQFATDKTISRFVDWHAFYDVRINMLIFFLNLTFFTSMHYFKCQIVDFVRL